MRGEEKASVTLFTISSSLRSSWSPTLPRTRESPQKRRRRLREPFIEEREEEKGHELSGAHPVRCYPGGTTHSDERASGGRKKLILCVAPSQTQLPVRRKEEAVVVVVAAVVLEQW